MTQLRIENARVVDPLNVIDKEITLFIKDGKFSDSCDDNATVIDAKGFIACPGFIDLYAHLREPGSSRKGTVASESLAALKAGFTTVFCSPNTNPVVDSIATVELIRQKAKAADAARVVPIGALTTGLEGERLSEMATLNNAGCLLIGHGDTPIDNTGVLLSALEYAASFDLPVSIRAIDSAIAGAGCAHAGSIATRLGLPSVSIAAETVAIAKLIELCRSTGCRIHFSRLSSARAVQLIQNAKSQGLPVSADVGIHHLYFTHEQIESFDANFNSAVPFRSIEDRAALRAAVKDGSIDAICSDHAPHDKDAKLAPFSSSAPGLSAFDAFIPLLLGLPNLLDMPLTDVLARVTTGPANIVANKNDDQNALFNSGDYSLNKNNRADMILIDPTAPAQLHEEQFLSQGKNSPLVGLTSMDECTGESIALEGVIKYSVINGSVRSLTRQ